MGTKSIFSKFIDTVTLWLSIYILLKILFRFTRLNIQLKTTISFILSITLLIILKKLIESHDKKTKLESSDKKLLNEINFKFECMTDNETAIYFTKLYCETYKSKYKNGIITNDNNFIYPILNRDLTQYELIKLVSQISNKNFNRIIIIFNNLNENILHFAENIKTLNIKFLHTSKLLTKIKEANIYPSPNINIDKSTPKPSPKLLSKKHTLKYFYTGISIYIISLFSNTNFILYTTLTVICFTLCILSLCVKDNNKNMQNV